MGGYLKIYIIGLSKPNYADYTYFMQRTLGYANTATPETINASDTLIDGITANINKITPIVAQRTAAEALYLKTKPYVGCQTLPQGKQIQKMRGLISDISTTEMAAHITTLGLTAVVEELATVTAQYAALIDQRAASLVANKLDATKTVRAEMDVQYDELVTIAFVTSVPLQVPKRR